MRQSGARQQNIKAQNRALVLRSVLNTDVRTRADIARQLGLTKTTLTNIVNELIGDGLIVESDAPAEPPCGSGRKSIALALSPSAPVVMGIMVQRGNLHVVIGNLQGDLLADEAHQYSGLLSVPELEAILVRLHARARAKTRQRILACGIACLGPINTLEGTIVRPHNFFCDERSYDIRGFVKRLTGLPTYLSNDASAGALAENLLGAGRGKENFIYISTYNGIGAGLFLNNSLYNGAYGQNGELGHMSINFAGPKCTCGNYGCLEAYADVRALLHRYENFRASMPNHPLFQKRGATIVDLMSLIDEGDALSMTVMTEYCRYLAFAVSNLITQLNVNLIIVAASTKINNHFFEQTLLHFVNERACIAQYEPIRVIQSDFGLNSSLYGSIAIIIDKLYSAQMYI